MKFTDKSAARLTVEELGAEDARLFIDCLREASLPQPTAMGGRIVLGFEIDTEGKILALLKDLAGNACTLRLGLDRDAKGLSFCWQDCKFVDEEQSINLQFSERAVEFDDTEPELDGVEPSFSVLDPIPEQFIYYVTFISSAAKIVKEDVQ